MASPSVLLKHSLGGGACIAAVLVELKGFLFPQLAHKTFHLVSTFFFAPCRCCAIEIETRYDLFTVADKEVDNDEEEDGETAAPFSRE